MKRLLLFTLLLAALPASAERLAIVGAKLYTMTSPEPLANATVVIEEGRITAVGAGLAPPAGARVIDAAGSIVTPGLMNAGTQLGIVELLSIKDTADQTVSKGALGAAFDVQFALNPNSTLLPLARADGLSRAISFPGGSASPPFSGQGIALRLSEGADLVDRAQIGMFATVNGMAALRADGSRSALWQVLRSALDEARDFGKQRRRGAPRDQLLNHLDAEALQPVLAGTMPLAISVARESDIRQVVRLADDYGVRVILYGGDEAWRVADLLAARKIPVVLDPFSNLPMSFDQLGARADNAALLQRAGVTIAFSSPGVHMSHNAGSVLREAAGVAVANGLPWYEGLKAMTVNPASIWGLNDHYGTVARGQDADLVIWDGDPLEPSTAARVVLVRGAEVGLATRQKALRDRYSPLKRSDPWPPAYR
jgi:imidazolonepropionase-like amidohydrolase